MVSAILRFWTHVSLRLASYRDGARVATRVFETGQKASDQTFANGRPEASANESRSLTYYRTASLDKGTSTKHPAKESLFALVPHLVI